MKEKVCFYGQQEKFFLQIFRLITSYIACMTPPLDAHWSPLMRELIRAKATCMLYSPTQKTQTSAVTNASMSYTKRDHGSCVHHISTDHCKLFQIINFTGAQNCTRISAHVRYTWVICTKYGTCQIETQHSFHIMNR